MARLIKLPRTANELANLLERRACSGSVEEGLLRAALRQAAHLLRANPELPVSDLGQAPAVDPMREGDFPLQEYFARRPPKFWPEALSEACVPPWKPRGT